MADEESNPAEQTNVEPADEQKKGKVIVNDAQEKDAAKKKDEPKQKTPEEIEAEKLDKQFNDLSKEFQKWMKCFALRDATIAIEWMTKLKNSAQTLEDRQLRIRFLKHFLDSFQTNDDIFNKHPFKNLPPNFGAPLSELQRFLPKSPNEALNPTEEEKASYIAELFANLPDKGKFLAAQPVPRSGTFYVLVTAQVPDKCAR